MRYAQGHKDHSHERILKTAKKFRRQGIAVRGMAGVVAEAGLTNGEFYSHFRSKTIWFGKDLNVRSMSNCGGSQKVMPHLNSSVS